jgi:hypothetical protein
LRILPVVILIIIIFAALYIPVTIPFKLSSIGKVYPHQEWRLMQDASGNITTTLADNKTGVRQLLQAFQFERGDLVNMELSYNDSSEQIFAGDTLLKIKTIIFQDRIQQLTNQLLVEQALLKSALAGDKDPVISGARKQLESAQKALILHEKNYFTNKRLLDEGLISELEFRAFENAWELAKVDISIAEKALEDVNTGVKAEDVEVQRSNITSLNNQVVFLENQLAKYVVTAPFNGVRVPVVLPEEMLVLYNTDEYIMQIPMKAEDIRYISECKNIFVTDIRNQSRYEATLLEVGTNVEVVGGRQVVFISASVKVPDHAAAISTGMAMTCEISCGEINQREYIRRILNFTWK